MPLRFLLLVLVLLGIPDCALAQSLAVERDPRAVAVLQQSLARLGSMIPRDLVATGSVEITEGSAFERGTVRLLFRGTDQAAEFVDTPEGKRSLVFSRGKVQGGLGRTVTTEATAPPRNARPSSLESALSSQPLYFPLAILREALANSEFAIEEVKGTEGAANQHRVAIKNSFTSKPKLRELGDATTRMLFIDSVTGLPSRFSTDLLAARGNSPRIPIEVDFSDYRDVGGILFPFQIEIFVNGTPWKSLRIENVRLNTGLTDADFSTANGREQ